MKKNLLKLFVIGSLASFHLHSAEFVVRVDSSANYTSSNKTGEQIVVEEDWANNGERYSCTAWSDAPTSISYGDVYDLTRDCLQDQTKSIYTYDVLMNGEQTLNNTVIETQTISITETDTITIPLYVDTSTLTGTTYANSQTLLSSGGMYSNFTLETWIKPHKAIKSTSVMSNTGIDGHYEENYVFYPPHGGISTGYHGVGLSVGTNGIKVFAHSDGYLPALYVNYQTISSTSWNHVVLSVINNVPYVYLNGSLIGVGFAPSWGTLYSPYELGTNDSYGNFYGELSISRVWNGALSNTQVADNYNKYIELNTTVGSSTLVEIHNQTEPY